MVYQGSFIPSAKVGFLLKFEILGRFVWPIFNIFCKQPTAGQKNLAGFQKGVFFAGDLGM